MNLTQRAILKTLAYADIFDYPLTLAQIHHWLIWSNPAPPNQSTLSLAISKLSQVTKHKSFYFLKNKARLVALSRRRTRYSHKKLALARRQAHWLKLIPFIKLVAVTGALSMNNSDKADDIDLIIITQTNRLWLTRFLAVVLLESLRLRRRPSSAFHTNKICLNLFLDESSLAIPLSRRDLYTAHEVCQVKPLWDRGDTYQKFLAANSWVKKYLPHSIKTSVPDRHKPTPPPRPNLLKSLEVLTFKLQLSYMKKKRTRERITKHSAFFHPRPTSKIVLNKYRQRLKVLRINEKN